MIQRKNNAELEMEVCSLLPSCELAENEKDSANPVMNIVYADFKPQQEVRRMLESKFPDVEFVTIRREYSLKAYAQAVLEMSQNTIYVVDENRNIVPLSLRAYLLSYLQKAEITKDIDEAIKNNATL